MTERLFLRLDGDLSHGPETTVPADTLRSFAVGAQLGAHVSQILLYRETFADGAEVADRVLPDGAVRLVIHLGDGTPAGPAAGPQGSVAIGAAAAPVLLRWRRSRMHSISVALRPGAASALLGVPAGELQGMTVALDAVWGPCFHALRERMVEQADDEARVALLRLWLEQRLSQSARPANPRAVQAAALLATSAGRMRPRGGGRRRWHGRAAPATDLPCREVGMSPKAWGRLARLHACLRALRGGPAAPWAALAADGGFYDQAHLANEFRALCGLSPTEFLQRGVSLSSKT